MKRDRTAADIVIVGAGPVGLTLACALAHHNRATVVCQKAPLDHDRRGLTLTVASHAILTHLGVTSLIDVGRIAAIRGMRVCYADDCVVFDPAELGRDALGYVIEYHELMRALTQRVLGHGNLIRRITGEAIEWTPSSHAGVLRLADGTLIEGALAVASEGTQSLLRGQAGIGLDSRAYGEAAISTIVRTSLPHAGAAWQRFLAGGPVALLPLPDPLERSLIWSVASARARELCALSDDGFAQALRNVTGEEFGELETNVARHAFPLARGQAKGYIAGRLALAGDCAHRVHPLAGQGVNLGLADAAALADVVADADARGLDPGSRAVLRRYERWRVSANAPMIAAIDFFHDMFPRPGHVLDRVRGASLRLFDTLAPLKREVMRHASGIKGDLPRLARPASTFDR